MGREIRDSPTHGESTCFDSSAAVCRLQRIVYCETRGKWGENLATSVPAPGACLAFMPRLLPCSGQARRAGAPR
jgi:hypothetical protein